MIDPLAHLLPLQQRFIAWGSGGGGAYSYSIGAAGGNGAFGLVRVRWTR